MVSRFYKGTLRDRSCPQARDFGEPISTDVIRKVPFRRAILYITVYILIFYESMYRSRSDVSSHGKNGNLPLIQITRFRV